LANARHESTSALIERLSARQREVLQLLARGLTNQEIGGVLGISAETVRTHVGALLARIQVSNRTEAAAAYLTWDASADRVAQVLERPAIAVLPLIALDMDARATTIAGGMTRDLVALFSRWCWFPVIASASTRDARTLGATNQQIGTRLGARFLLDGALRSAGADWRITANIVDASSGSCVWAGSHDFPRAALFAVQDEICQAIVASAYPLLIATVHAGLRRDCSARDLAAWELTHESLVLQAARARDANVHAQAGFNAALAREPTLVLARFGLGLASYDEVLNQWGPAQPALDRLAACAEHCIRLAPHMAEGYFLAGRHLQTLGQHARAIAPLTEAIGHNPSFVSAHALLGQVLLIAGRNDEGLLRIRHACRLGPRAFVAGLAAAHFVRREYSDALVAAEEALAINPHYPFARALAAASAWWTDDRERAVRHRQALLSVQPTFSQSSFRSTFGGNIEAVSRIAEALEAIPAQQTQ
jgi:TolB-like protein